MTAETEPKTPSVTKSGDAKKGNRSWTPPTGEVIEKEPGWGYRWTAESEIPVRLQEGWELVKARPGQPTFQNGKDRTFGGIPLDTVVARKNTVLMRMPQDMVDQRNAYWNKRAYAQKNSLQQKTREFADGGELYGSIRSNDTAIQTIIDD